jgi:hypothetical protein
MTAKTGGLRPRICAWALARFNTKHERFAEQYKQQLMSNLSGIQKWVHLARVQTFSNKRDIGRPGTQNWQLIPITTRY